MTEVHKWHLHMVTCIKMLQLSSLCLVLLIGLTCSSFLEGINSVEYDSVNDVSPNITNMKNHEKSGSGFSKRNYLDLKQDTNSIMLESILKERRHSFVASYKYPISNLQCEATDVCGECGGVRVDKCNVCAGNNRCVSCDAGRPDLQLDACGNCLLPESPSWNNCSAVTSIHPVVLDKAMNSPIQLKLELSKALENGDDSLKCVVEQNNMTVSATVVAVEDNLVVLSVSLERLTTETECRLGCDGWSVLQHSLAVVNSLSLSVSSVSPDKLRLGQPTQLKLMVHGISAPVDLFCFIMDNNRTILVIQPTNQVAGNPISSTVVCIVAVFHLSSSELFVGVSFTRTALSQTSNNNTIKLKLLSIPLVPLGVDFLEDLSHVILEFNQNIDGPNDCSGVFTATSVQLLGSGIKCEYRGNKLVLKLGKGATLRPRDVLRLSQDTDSTSGLRLAGTTLPPLLSQGSVHLPFTQRALPAYLVVGPSKVCQPSQVSVMVVPLSTEVLWYNWSLVVTEAQPSGHSSHRQRHNLLVWLGAREILRPARHANLHYLPINSSLLMPNINYRIEVVARNTLGFSGRPVQLNVQLMENSTDPHLGMVILSPPTSAASQPLPLELRVTSGCGLVCLDHLKFRWKVTKDNQTTTLSSSWLKATVPGRMLQAPGLYNIACVMTNNSVAISKAETQVLVQPAKTVLTVVPAALILGTGHPLILDVTSSLQDRNISNFQIFWKCKRVDSQECITPGSRQPVSTTHSSALSQPKLTLPPGSISVGRYQWTVVVSVEGVEYSSSADVEVVPGNPPFLTVGPPILGSFLSIPGSAMGLRPGCGLKWASLHSSGSSREVTSGTRGDLTLMIPAKMLQSGAKYCLRFSAFCSAADYAHADVIVPADPVPVIEALEVSPLQGVALITEFYFSTKRTSKVGSIYSFGYYPPTGPPVFVYSSAYFLSTMALLPVFSGAGSQVKTLLRVCSTGRVCANRDGPLIQTSLPTSLTPQQIRYLSKLTSTAIDNEDPFVAMTTASSVISTTKLLKDQTANQLMSSDIIEAILRRISVTSQRIGEDVSTKPEAIAFLDSVIRVLPLLQLNDTALSTLVLFRDKLAATSKPVGKPVRLVESQLLMEPRTVREKRQQPIPADIPPDTPDTVEIWLRTSEAAILSFSPSKSVEEKQKLLTNLDSYITGLCRWLPDPQIVCLGSRVVNVSVQKLSIAENVKVVNIPNCPDTFEPLPAKAYLGKDFISKFKKASVDYICLSGFHFPFASLDMIFISPPGFIQLSSVYRQKILTYSLRNVNSEPPPRVKLVFPLESPPPNSSQHMIQCCIIVSSSWVADKCETIQANESAVECKCPPYEYYSVFAIPLPATTTTTMVSVVTTTENEPPPTTTTTTTTTITAVTTTITTTSATTTTTTTTSPSTTISTQTPPMSTTPTPVPIVLTTETSQPVKKVAFRIAEKFTRVVGGNSSQFSNLIKSQLIDQLGLPKESIQDIYVTDGSILVTLALRNTQQLSAEECMMELAQALDVGQLNLRTADNQPLEVPRQPLQVLREQTGEQSGLSAMFLASASLGLCGLVVAYVTLVTLVTKHSKRKEALRAVQRKAAEKVPRYPSLPLPHSLDGSSLRYGTLSGDDLDSGIYDSDAGKINAIGKAPKQRVLQSTNF